MRRFITLILAITSITTDASAGAWIQPKGHGQVIAQASYFSSSHYFDGSGTRTSQTKFTKYELQPYAEYGLRDNLTIGGSAAIQRDEQSGVRNHGVADPEIFARSVLWHDAVQLVSIQPLLKFSSAFENASSPRGGSRSTDAELSLLYGRSLTLVSPRDYLDARAGYRYRSNRLNDQWRADVALGLEVYPGLQIIPAIRMIRSTNLNGAAAFIQNGEQDYDLTKIELGAIYRMDDTHSIGLTAFQHIDGRQTGDGSGVIFSLTQRF